MFNHRDESYRHCLWGYGLMDLYGLTGLTLSFPRDGKKSRTAKTLIWYDYSMRKFQCGNDGNILSRVIMLVNKTHTCREIKTKGMVFSNTWVFILKWIQWHIHAGSWSLVN